MNGLAAAGRPGRLPGHAWPIRGVVLARARNGGHLRATRLFVRRARPGRYFNRVPSLPATDDGSAGPLAEDLSTGSGGREDSIGDADMEPGTVDAGAAPGTAATDGGSRPTEAEPCVDEADAGQGVTGPDAEPPADEPGTGTAARTEDESRADAPATGEVRADAEP